MTSQNVQMLFEELKAVRREILNLRRVLLCKERVARLLSEIKAEASLLEVEAEIDRFYDQIHDLQYQKSELLEKLGC